MRFFTEDDFRIQGMKMLLELQQLINEFMKLPDVIDGSAFNMGSNKPRSWFEAFSTTGYCVKVSQVFIDKMLKNHTVWKDAKTLSIAIDPNKFGKCGDGSDNAWHTCVDLNDGYIVDLTIAQFGAKYVEHYIWQKVDWLNEFQALNDTHDIGILPFDQKDRYKLNLLPGPITET